MSDSLFLDPFAQPMPSDSAGTTGRTVASSSEEGPTSLTVVIPLAADRAVEAFLEYVHLWWPGELRTCGEDSHLGFEEGALLEEGLDGGRHRWADVVGIDGASLALRWFGATGDQAGVTGLDVTLAFAIESTTQTLVTVGAGGATSFRQDWQPVLEAFARFTGGTVGATTA